jgi:hypothetical protein
MQRRCCEGSSHANSAQEHSPSAAPVHGSILLFRYSVLRTQAPCIRGFEKGRMVGRYSTQTLPQAWVCGPCLLRDARSFPRARLRPRSGEQPTSVYKEPETDNSRQHRKQFRTTLWQKNFYDHILRPQDSFAGVAGYIWMNPVRKGLCSDPLEYPHSGSLVVEWKKATSPVKSWVPDWKDKKNKTPA